MSQRGLLAVERFVLPERILELTLESLAAIGRRRVEGFVVWGGVLEEGGRLLRFQSALTPRQQAYRTQMGLLVVVDSDGLFEINKTLNDLGQILAAQVHTHPGEAYHSETDDHQPIVTLVGGLSLVIPFFAQRGLEAWDDFRWYRLEGYADWRAIDADVEVIVV